MTAAARIRDLLAECQRERADYISRRDGTIAGRGNGILAAACAVREAALRQCLKIVEEGQ